MTDRRTIGISVLANGTEERSRLLEVEKGVLARNQEIAETNRARFAEHGLLVVNVLSSPGSGKTELLSRLLGERPELPAAVIVGDLATDNDAERLRASGADVAQIHTNGVCHLEAAMVASAAERLELAGKRLLGIENVGNLVCPASYDLGESLRMVLVSVTEGEDKPLKYPVIFKRADLVVITKMDLAEPVGFDAARLSANLEAVCPQATVFAVSARSGDGIPALLAHLEERLASGRESLG